MFKVNNKNTRTTSNDVVLMFLLLTFNIFHTFSSVSIVDFEQVNVTWAFSYFIENIFVRASKGIS